MQVGKRFASWGVAIGLGVAISSAGLVMLRLNNVAPPAESAPPPSGSAARPSEGAAAPSGSVAAPSCSPTPPSAVPIDSSGAPTFRPRIGWVGTQGWQIQHPSKGTSITEAFADAPSYPVGSTIRLAVSTSAAQYRVSVIRVGPRMPVLSTSTARQGILQGAAVLADASTLEVRAPWRYTYSQALKPNWGTGIYLAKVTGIGGADAYAPFVIRSARPATFLMVANTITDAAYNAWGGTSLYTSQRGVLPSGPRHAVAVSLDRPFDAENGAGRIFEHLAAFVIWLEGNDYDVGYTTDYDLALHPEEQPLPKVVLFSGHDEYWGRSLRAWLDEHVLRRGDLNLGVFAANTGYYPVSFAGPSSTGPRTLVVFKEALTDPALAGRPAYLPDCRPKLLLYRNLPAGDPDPANLPEQLLFGVQYGFIATEASPYYLAPTIPPFLLTGTNLRPGDSLGRLVGGEVDYIDPALGIGEGDSILAQATGFQTRYGQPGLAQAVVRQLPSGARVFASGTFNWEWGLDSGYAKTLHVPEGFEQLTRNLLGYLAGSCGSPPKACSSRP